MAAIFPFLIGFLIATLSIVPPGLINMTAAKIGLRETKSRAMMFAFGASLMVFFQTYIAIVFAKFIDKNPEIIVRLREIGLVVFIVLTFYFWFTKKSKTIQKVGKLHSKKSRFFMGLLLSALNLFPIPFYVFVSVALASFHFFLFTKPFVFWFVLGSGSGSFFAFYLYIVLFQKMESKTQFIQNNMNKIIATITGFVAILTLINIINFHSK
jgi:threonine/homoserine/homoserine lactone efflux protein